MTITAGGNSNTNLGAARAAKKDEFYTQLSDIEKELRHYRRHFEGKVVYCNADDPRISNFFHYFSHNFERLGLKKLITGSSTLRGVVPGHAADLHGRVTAMWVRIRRR